MTAWLRLLDVPVEAKARALSQAVTSVRNGKPLEASAGVKVFDISPERFAPVPGSPFAYWVSGSVRDIFSRFRRFDSEERTATVGLQSSDDFRFLRLWWEPVEVGLLEGWPSFAKGGSFSRFYADLSLVVNWANDGATIKAFAETTPGSKHWSRNIRSAEHYLRPGLTWPRRTNGLSFRVLPRGSIFADKGPALFVAEDFGDRLLALSAVLNSRPFGYLVSVQLARTELAQSYEVGLIQQTPIPDLSSDSSDSLAQMACRAWSLKQSLDTGNETSHAFLMPPGVNAKIAVIDAAAVERELAGIQAQIDDLTFNLYGISAEDRATIEAPIKAASSNESETESDDADEADDDTSVGNGSEALGSWLVGVAFGRFDPRLATGERAIPPEPEPFDPLPARSPGMYPEGEEPAGRPDILVDDEGHADDLAASTIAVAERVKVDAPENLRAWLAKDFFPLHIKMYSKSRRKVPIYWQLATPSASYSVWLYIHAFSKDTLFRVQNDYVAPKLAHEERRLELLTSEVRDGATAAQRNVLAAQERFVEELRAFLEEVKRVAPLWNPNLDDGVIINFAPLWRLVPQNKSWQKELKLTWDALCEEKYDWAHLAMHFWPERVVSKCAKDRSLAIAHGLEDVFWAEGTDGKWTARKTPTRSVDELVRERTSPAVESALRSLLEAPVAGGTSLGRKGSGHRRTKATAIPQDPPALAARSWSRPHSMARGEIQAAILAVLKANGAPMDLQQARLAVLLCLEPHLLTPQLDAADKKTWLRFVGADARKPITASIDTTIQEWGQALSGLRGRGRLNENLHQNTWAIGTDTDAIDTRGWPERRAEFVINALHRLQASMQADAVILKLPAPIQQWFANAA